MERNWSYTILDGEHKGITLYSGRYCAVCAIVFCYSRTNEKWYVLANKRGSGVPDFEGLWNLPCGFIERGETGEQAASRETFEETGVFIYPDQFVFSSVETDPYISNNGNISLRYISSLRREILPSVESDTNKLKGEKDEVSEIKWIPINEIENYKWAFHHKELLMLVNPCKL